VPADIDQPLPPHGVPDAAAIRAQLNRIVASHPFANAARLSRFLCFVVEKTLASDSAQVKESVIAVDCGARSGSPVARKVGRVLHDSGRQ
jgi:hypothetical protein